VHRSSSLPKRRRELHFEPRSFGAPDIGSFEFGKLEWLTDSELCVRDHAVVRRVPGALTLSLAVHGALSVEAKVGLAEGGSATLLAAGVDPSPPANAAGPTPANQPVTLQVTGRSLAEVELAGVGISLRSIVITEPFVPLQASGDLRLVSAQLPRSATDPEHWVEIMCYRDTELAGWSIDWYDALTPEKVASYHVFGAHDKLPEGRSARIHGGLSSGAGSVHDFFGGVAPVIAEAGVIFRVVSPQGVIAHEFAALPDSAFTAASGFQAVPSGDGTRGLLLSPGDLERGYWKLSFAFGRETIGLPRLSVAGSTDPERATLAFLVP
jgi:hypothetical protein